MATTTKINSLTVGLNASATQAEGLIPAVGASNAVLVAVSAALGSGSGAGLVAQLFQQQYTLAASSNATLDMYAFGGATDAAGNAYTMAQIKGLFIQNLGVSGAVVEADTLTIGQGGSSAAWTQAITPNTAGIVLYSGAFIFLANPTANTGYVVGSSTTNHTLKFTTGSNSGTITYNVIAFG